ncbi:D-2-hydroxyacid dehydrogenase [Paenibacillus senegalensis]|uniref:D-2-hydroxyacid dehydrogenase n=1 Tax=Paenibacillus senegalensis TaxID=1465766 RepID=UPI00028923D1|nr:D-2-hydroxyacid dehydrogenase [Paenibacillus senegalensis]
MKIVVLDGYTLNPGDISWSPLEALGSLTVYDRTDEEQIVERVDGAEVIFTNKTPLNAAVLKRLTGLKYIGVLATGYDVVDIAEAKRQGIVVTNIPEYGTYSTAQMTIALLLELCHRAGSHSDSVRRGDWASYPHFCYWNSTLVELYGKTMGIIGSGRIGRRVASIARALGMRTIGTSRSAEPGTERDGIEIVSHDQLLQTSDVISLHCPLTAETEGMMNREAFQQMKRSAFLINTARGKLVVEQDLADALNEGSIAGAAVDVLASEPPDPANPLLTADRCIVTPHIAWATTEARSRLMTMAADNLAAFLQGESKNRVN